MRIKMDLITGPARRAVLLAVVAFLLAPTAVFAGSTTYTLNADFDLGLLSGVNHNLPGNDQLQLNVTGTTFPVLWIANAGEDTLTKFDSNTNKEVARYRTWFGPSGVLGYRGHINEAWSGAAPSRTAVDIDGNAYVLNRHFWDNRSALLMKVLSSGGVDRNGNGIIDTSADSSGNGIIESSEMKNLVDSNNNGVLDPAEITDERVAWAARVGNPGGIGRALCIGDDGNIWVGLYNQSAYYKVRSTDGTILQGPINVPWTPYGCAVDSNGILWSASLYSNLLGRIDTKASPPAVTSYGSGFGNNYAIALGNNKVYLASFSGYSYLQFNPTTNSFSRPAATWFTSTGISVDGDGNILSGRYSGGGVVKFNKDTGGVLWNAPSQRNTETRGVIVDADNNIWQINLGDNSMSKYRGIDGAALGVFPVGNRPYTYSDASGFAARNVTSPTGTWTVVKDGGPNVVWGKVSWSADTPAGSNIQVSVRTAASEAALDLASYTAVSNGGPFTKTGQFIQIQSRLNSSSGGASPILKDLTLQSSTCDVNGDGSINKTDIALITAARNMAASPNDSRDADGDGMISVNDARACVLRCTKPNCAL